MPRNPKQSSARARSDEASSGRRPIMPLLDLLGRRWTLRVLWELRDGRSVSFRDLQERCDGMSSSVLAQRLGELRKAGIVAADGGYALTPEGRELLEAFEPVYRWSQRWGRRSA